MRSPAGSGVLRIGVKRIPGGEFSAYAAHELKVGDELEVMTPLGRFGTADEVTHVVLALLDATWATGEIWGIGR